MGQNQRVNGHSVSRMSVHLVLLFPLKNWTSYAADLKL
ncbi:MAG: hypothetical protein ACJA2C_001085 [Marinoscillum sp.]|jgi:hypothetical protein